MAISDIDSQTIRLSDVLNLKNPKTIWSIKLIFLLPLKLQKICYFIIPKYSGQSVCIILDFWRVWLVNLNDGFHSYIVLVESNKYYKKSKIYPLPVNALYNYKIIKIIFVNMLMQNILPRCGHQNLKISLKLGGCYIIIFSNVAR